MDNINAIYCLDTSAFIDLHKYYGRTQIPELWQELNNLFSDNKIISHRIVFDELTTSAKKPSALSSWISEKRQHFKNKSWVQTQHVAKIVGRFPGLIDPNCEKDQADPWLIALITEEQDKLGLFRSEKEFITVSQESPSSPNRIPAVCRYYGIQHFDLTEFFNFNNWKLKFVKT